MKTDWRTASRPVSGVCSRCTEGGRRRSAGKELSTTATLPSPFGQRTRRSVALISEPGNRPGPMADPATRFAHTSLLSKRAKRSSRDRSRFSPGHRTDPQRAALHAGRVCTDSAFRNLICFLQRLILESVCAQSPNVTRSSSTPVNSSSRPACLTLQGYSPASAESVQANETIVPYSRLH
jgi:hypothetical protein